MPKEMRNVAASVRARLLTLSKSTGQPFDVLLTRFVLERLLYRLSRSRYAKSFVLKGAMLLATWEDNPHRVTRDLDLLGFGESEAEGMLTIFREVLAVDEGDGVLFNIDELKVAQIREELQYGGLRLKTRAALDSARVPVVVDIGFGDAIAPGLEDIEYPVLLGFPAPHIRAYARETVIAEKFQAMVMLGRANSRMKDFHDVWALSRNHAFEGDRLAQAIKATFERRKTDIPTATPDALTKDFAADPAKQQQWRAFIEDVASNPGPLASICVDLEAFLMPHARRAREI
jgi:predicted nucleotidyltransferase component of viral defense system